MENEQHHLFDDAEFQLVQASMAKRFANYIIDIIVFYVIFFVFALFWAAADRESFLRFNDETSTFLPSLLYTVVYGFVMGVTESIFKGKTLGKLITNTRAVNQDGSTITSRTALLRGLCRAVPFCAFSALGNPSYPWQDRWTHTYVIDEKLSKGQDLISGR